MSGDEAGDSIIKGCELLLYAPVDAPASHRAYLMDSLLCATPYHLHLNGSIAEKEKEKRKQGGKRGEGGGTKKRAKKKQ